MNKVSFFLLCICFVAFAKANMEIPPELVEMAVKLHKTCVEQTGVSEAAIEEAKKANFIEDNALKCYTKCLLDEIGMIEDGVVNFDVMVELAPDRYKQQVRDGVAFCKDRTGKDLCDLVYNLQKCAYEFAPDNYLFF